METQMLKQYQNDVTRKYVLGGVEEDCLWSSLYSLSLSFFYFITLEQKVCKKRDAGQCRRQIYVIMNQGSPSRTYINIVWTVTCVGQYGCNNGEAESDILTTRVCALSVRR
jgi:hypothetical protein